MFGAPRDLTVGVPLDRMPSTHGERFDAEFAASFGENGWDTVVMARATRTRAALDKIQQVTGVRLPDAYDERHVYDFMASRGERNLAEARQKIVGENIIKARALREQHPELPDLELIDAQIAEDARRKRAAADEMVGTGGGFGGFAGGTVGELARPGNAAITIATLPIGLPTRAGIGVAQGARSIMASTMLQTGKGRVLTEGMIQAGVNLGSQAVTEIGDAAVRAEIGGEEQPGQVAMNLVGAGLAGLLLGGAFRAATEAAMGRGGRALLNTWYRERMPDRTMSSAEKDAATVAESGEWDRGSNPMIRDQALNHAGLSQRAEWAALGGADVLQGELARIALDMGPLKPEIRVDMGEASVVAMAQRNLPAVHASAKTMRDRLAQVNERAAAIESEFGQRLMGGAARIAPAEPGVAIRADLSPENIAEMARRNAPGAHELLDSLGARVNDADAKLGALPKKPKDIGDADLIARIDQDTAAVVRDIDERLARPGLRAAERDELLRQREQVIETLGKKNMGVLRAEAWKEAEALRKELEADRADALARRPKAEANIEAARANTRERLAALDQEPRAPTPELPEAGARPDLRDPVLAEREALANERIDLESRIAMADDAIRIERNKVRQHLNRIDDWEPEAPTLAKDAAFGTEAGMGADVAGLAQPRTVKMANGQTLRFNTAMHDILNSGIGGYSGRARAVIESEAAKAAERAASPDLPEASMAELQRRAAASPNRTVTVDNEEITLGEAIELIEKEADGVKTLEACALGLSTGAIAA